MASKTHISKTEEGQVEKAVQIRSDDPGSPVANQTWINTTDKKQKFYDGADTQTVGAAGVGSASTFALFQAEDGDISAFSNISVESGSPIAGDKSYSVSAFPATAPAVSVDARRSGASASCTFVQSVASGSYKAQVVDNSANVLAEVTIDSDSAQKVVMKYGIPSAATTVQFKIIDDSSGTTIVIDDIEFSDGASALGTSDEVQWFKHSQAQNAMHTLDGALRMDLTSATIDYNSGTSIIEVSDSGSATEYKALKDCSLHFHINGRVTATSQSFSALVDGVIVIKGGQGSPSGLNNQLSGIVELQVGEVLSFSNGGPALESTANLFEIGFHAVASNPAVVSTVDSVAPARYVRTSNQSIPNGAATIVDFNVLEEDAQGHVTTGASWQYEVEADGDYDIGAGIRFAATSGQGSMILTLRKGGANLRTLDRFDKAGTESKRTTLTGSTNVPLLKGDILDFEVFQDNGSALNIEGASSICWVYVKRADPQVELATTPVVKFGNKFLTTSFTGNVPDIAELKFSNLEIGKAYRVSLNARFENLSAPTTGRLVIQMNHDGLTLARSFIYADDQNVASYDSKVFIATATTVTFGTNSATGASLEIQGNGSASHTHAQLEELPGAYETSQWD